MLYGSELHSRQRNEIHRCCPRSLSIRFKMEHMDHVWIIHRSSRYPCTLTLLWYVNRQDLHCHTRATKSTMTHNLCKIIYPFVSLMLQPCGTLCNAERARNLADEGTRCFIAAMEVFQTRENDHPQYWPHYPTILAIKTKNSVYAFL